MTGMKLMITKVYRLRREGPSNDAVNLAKQAAGRYHAQRYRDPSELDHLPWNTVSVNEHTRIFDFPGSDILIAETVSPDPADTLAELQSHANRLEAEIDKAVSTLGHEVSALWASHWMILKPKERHEHQGAIRRWLADSIRPDDAQRIINGEIDASLTWLRYVAVESPSLNDYRRSMRIAQYYYAEFDQVNSQLLELISKLSQKHIPGMSKVTALRRALDMKRLQLREDLRLLPRRIKHTVEGILRHWEFEQLDDSVNRLQEVCSNLIADQWERKAGLSRVATEVILAAIGLFGFLNLMIAWAIFSRQVATNPMLLVDEPVLPFTARVVANMPLDSIILVSSVVGLVILFIYIAFRRGYR